MGKFFKRQLCICICYQRGCFGKKNADTITFGVANDYPPFEYKVNNKWSGFDIELASLIAKQLNLEVKFKEIEFSQLLTATRNGEVDAAISAISIIPERMKDVKFSRPYHNTGLSMLHLPGKQITSRFEIGHRRIACQLGSVVELWLQDNANEASLVLFDEEHKAFDILRIGQIDGILLENGRLNFFQTQHTNNFNILTCSVMENVYYDYAIALPEKSTLKDKIDEALEKIEKNGELDNLKKKWKI